MNFNSTRFGLVYHNLDVVVVVVIVFLIMFTFLNGTQYFEIKLCHSTIQVAK